MNSDGDARLRLNLPSIKIKMECAEHALLLIRRRRHLQKDNATIVVGLLPVIIMAATVVIP